MERQTINQLAQGVLAELVKMHYAEISITHFRQAFNRIERYATKNGETFISDSLTKRYLFDNHGWDIDYQSKPTAHVTSQLRVIRVLQFYEEFGSIPSRICGTKEIPTCFKHCYDMYISECVDRGLSNKTITTRSDDIYDFLVFAHDKGFSSITEVEKGFLDKYLLKRNAQAPGAIPRILSSLRCFFRCMFSNGVIAIDLSFFIPSGSRYPTKTVQKLWTGEEVKDLLGFVNRSDSIGKRDYALMLLVLRYGMRTGDILNLRLTDINWQNMIIQFRQEKTSVPNALPILDDVGWALADWLTNARPKQATTNHVFILLTAPYCGLKNLRNVFNRHMAAAGISNSGYGKSGPHSLRHALASNMLAERVPLPVISSVLGHTSSASTMVYLHSDVEGLRQCALDIEEGES
ncbi:site-specific integrase [Anoxynatronum buryatiense]|uniref:Site-specific recombinase XerD n=1 Tax=Anoxynatronum buryatiense TaxID=489973 RepID=A0AA45WYR7_9CLOT|nr:site-specific integrase [Anoxynatronum buryatiense]SMP68099.1 Site-specific recombinase XerD [Anoxynatronum buryatiense]